MRKRWYVGPCVRLKKASNSLLILLKWLKSTVPSFSPTKTKIGDCANPSWSASGLADVKKVIDENSNTDTKR